MRKIGYSQNSWQNDRAKLGQVECFSLKKYEKCLWLGRCING